ncbi:MAG: NDP-sugar synthase, partial [Candidatus Latescibacterota bacterium]
GLRPAPLRPLVDRPFIQHVVECLVQEGITELDLVLSDRPEEVEWLLGDGTRWGGHFRYHLVRHPAHPYGAVRKALIDAQDGFVLLGHADRLPDPAVARLRPPAGSAEPILFYWRDRSVPAAEDRPRWSGWAWVPRGALPAFGEHLAESALLDLLLDLVRHKPSIVEVRRPASARSYADLLAAHRAALEGHLHGLLLSGRERRRRVRIGRNVHISPSARLLAPVYIGQNTRVGPNVQLGPGASVGDGCVLEAGCAVADSVVFPGTYVGEKLEVRHAVVEQRQLTNVRMGTSLAVTEDFVLGSVTDTPVRRWLSQLPARVVAVGMLAAFLPLLAGVGIVLKVRRGWALQRRQTVRLPVRGAAGRWPTFTLRTFEEGAGARVRRGWRDVLLRFLPGLASVVRGDLRLVGVRPRAPQEVAALPPVWRDLYLNSQAGLVCEADVKCAPGATDEELQVAEAVQAAVPGTGRSLAVLWAYLVSMHRGA